jgi:hypothetical protein
MSKCIANQSDQGCTAWRPWWSRAFPGGDTSGQAEDGESKAAQPDWLTETWPMAAMMWFHAFSYFSSHLYWQLGLLQVRNFSWPTMSWQWLAALGLIDLDPSIYNPPMVVVNPWFGKKSGGMVAHGSPHIPMKSMALTWSNPRCTWTSPRNYILPKRGSKPHCPPGIFIKVLTEMHPAQKCHGLKVSVQELYDVICLTSWQQPCQTPFVWLRGTTKKIEHDQWLKSGHVPL